MRQAFEAAAKAYETVKKSIQEKWEGFKKKFEGTKAEASQEVMNAKTPEDLIALGKKLQQQGETLKLEEEGLKQEEGMQIEKEVEMNVTKDEADYQESVKAQESADMDKMIEIDRIQTEKEAQEQVEHEEYVKKTQEDEAAKLAEIRAKLNGEDAGMQTQETIEFTKVENVEESGSQEALIERIGTPSNELFEKYGSKMRESADELVVTVQKMAENEKKLREVEFKSPEWQKLWDENRALNERRNELSEDASWGNRVISNNGQRASESYDQYTDRRSGELKKYREVAMDDPHVVLRMIEAGELGGDANGDGLGKVSERLMSDPEFVHEAIKLSKKYTENSYAGWFWRNVSGEAKANRQLFLEAIKVNHLNYQFGSQEMKSDPEIQKIALESGLDPIYLYKE